MTVTTSVLANDGGAPARIINFECATALKAGYAVGINALGKAIPMGTANELMAGFALVDCAVGDMASVITGSGLILYVHLDGGSTNVVVGDMLECSTAGTVDGALAPLSRDDSGNDAIPVAIALEAATDTADNNITAGALFKVLVK